MHAHPELWTRWKYVLNSLLVSIPSFTEYQGCSLGLNISVSSFGLKAVSRGVLERLGLISVLKVQRLGLVSVSRVWKNRTSRSHYGLEDRRRSFGFRDFRFVNIHAMHQACGYIRKKLMDLNCKKQVVKWQTSPVSVFKLRYCGLETCFGTSRSHLGLESLKNGTSQSCLGLEGWRSQSCLGLVTYVLWTFLQNTQHLLYVWKLKGMDSCSSAIRYWKPVG